jgi:hypothetical protein
MPQTLEEFVRGTPFADEVARLRKVEASAREFLRWWQSETELNPFVEQRIANLEAALEGVR